MNAHRVFYLVFHQGNIVDPHDMLDKFEVDTFRWYVVYTVLAGFLVGFHRRYILLSPLRFFFHFKRQVHV